MKADDILFVPSSTRQSGHDTDRRRRHPGRERGVHRCHPLVNRSKQFSDQALGV